MTNSILNAYCTTFLITLKFKGTNISFIFQKPLELKYILENYDKNGIDKIRELDPAKAKFTTISKDRILQLCNWDTEVIIYLQKHYFFKK